MIEDINLESSKRAALDEFLSRIRKRLSSQLTIVRLFGSQARGEATEESDIDLFIVVKSYSKEVENSILDEAYEVSLKHDVVITPLVYGEEEVNSPLFQVTPFYKNVMEEGISIWQIQNSSKGGVRMSAKEVYEDILELLKTLPPEKISEARDFIEFLSQRSSKKRDFSKLCGTLTNEDAEAMTKAIEEGCEKINYEEMVIF